MALKNRLYDVYLVNPADPEGDPIQHRVTVVHVDQLRGELEAAKMKLPPPGDAPINYMTVCLWCALVHRLKLYDQDYRTFKFQDVIEIEPVTDEDGEPAEEDVDPTQPAAVDGSP